LTEKNPKAVLLCENWLPKGQKVAENRGKKQGVIGKEIVSVEFSFKSNSLSVSDT